MKPTLKRKLYFHIFLVTVFIILANRFSTQALLLGQLEQRGWQDLGNTLLACESSLDQPGQFRLCAQQRDALAVASVLSHAYHVCPARSSRADWPDPGCAHVEDTRASWLLKTRWSEGRVDVLQTEVQGESWWGARRSGQVDGPHVWLQASSIQALRDDLWNIRDRNLGYMLPVILVMLGLLTLYVSHLLMRPIRLLESTLSSLTSTNLGQSSNLQAPYQEFERIVEVFEDLRTRLSDSFQKARRFAGDASHELRTPLTILRGNAEQLINDLPVGSEHQVRMRMISEEIERLIDITEKLLLLSRADGNSMVKEESEFAISGFLEELVSDSQVFHPELTIRGAIQADQRWMCDQRLIQQLIYNLYSNAVKYNVPNGWIRVDLHPRGQDLVLEFENPSEDIPARLSELAFERFYRGNAAHSRKIDGLGLGLSLCQEIARLHGAALTLEVVSASTVVVRLVMPRG